MSDERKRGPGGDSGWRARMASAKKAARRERGSTSVSVTTPQPGGVAAGPSGAGPLQPQAAAGRAQVEENAVAQQGSGRGADDDPRTQDLINRVGTSSANCGELRTRDLLSSIDRGGTSSASHQAGGSNGGEGSGSAPWPLLQGHEARARTALAINTMGPAGMIFPGNTTGTLTTAPPPPRRIMTQEDWRMAETARAALGYLCNLYRIKNRQYEMQYQQRFGFATPYRGPSNNVPGGKLIAWTPGDQRGEASSTSRGGTTSLRHGASSSTLRESAPATASAAAASQRPVAATGGSGDRRPQLQANVRVNVRCPYCGNRFPNLACLVCANVAAGLVVGPDQRHPHRYPGQLPSAEEQRLRQIVVAAMADQRGRPVKQPVAAEASGSHLHQPQPQPQPQPQSQPQPQPPPEPGLCPHCRCRQGTITVVPDDESHTSHTCLCRVCKKEPTARCRICSVIAP